MITEIRNSLKTGGFKIILWVMLLSMIIVFIPNLFKRGGEGYYATLASINGRSIELIDFERKVYQETERINMFRQQFGPQADIFLKSLGLSDPKTIALNALIQDELLNDVVDKLGIVVSPEYIAEKLHDPSYIMEELTDIIPYGVFDHQGINITMINHYLAQHRLSMKDFEAKIENKIKRSMVLSLVAASAYVPNAQIKDYFIKHYLTREYTILTFPLDAYLKKVKLNALSDKDVAAYFEKEHKAYWIPEKRSGTQWKFSPQAYGITVTPKDSEAYYTSHKSQFLESPLQVQVRRILFVMDQQDKKSFDDAQKKAEAIRQELKKNPSRFEELARASSDDKTTAAQGGLLPFFKKGDKDPEFERAALRLQNDGDISDVIHTEQGLEILQRVARKAATYKPLSQVEDSVKNLVMLQKFKAQFTDDITKMMAIQDKEKKTAAFNEFIKKKGALRETINALANDGSPFADKVFKLKKDDWGYLFVNDQGLVVIVNDIKKAHKPELSLVKNRVEQDLYKHNALELLKKDMESVRGKSVADIKTKFPFVTSKQTGPIGKYDKQKLSSFESQGISDLTFESLNNAGDQTTALHDSGGSLVVLTQVEPFKKDQFEAHKNILANLLYDEQKQLVQKGFIASLYRNATINLTESLINFRDENSL